MIFISLFVFVGTHLYLCLFCFHYICHKWVGIHQLFCKSYVHCCCLLQFKLLMSVNKELKFTIGSIQPYVNTEMGNVLYYSDLYEYILILKETESKTFFFWLLFMVNMETESKIYFTHDCRPNVYLMVTIEIDSTTYFAADFKPNAYTENTIETDNKIYFLSLLCYHGYHGDRQ